MIDMKKRYRTRDGRDVRLLCVDGPGTYPVIGIVGDDLITCTEYGMNDIERGMTKLDIIKVRTAEDVIADVLYSHRSIRYIAMAVDDEPVTSAIVDALRKAGLLKEGDA